MFGQLEELGAKYSDYKWANNSQMVFHDPETEDQKQKANKIARQTQSILWLVLCLFFFRKHKQVHYTLRHYFLCVVFLVLTIAFADSTSGTVIMLLLSGIAGAIAVTNQIKKVQVFTGKAVYKEKKRTNNSSTRRTYTYFTLHPVMLEDLKPVHILDFYNWL